MRRNELMYAGGNFRIALQRVNVLFSYYWVSAKMFLQFKADKGLRTEISYGYRGLVFLDNCFSIYKLFLYLATQYRSLLYGF